MKSSAPTQRAPGGKDSLCDSCEPSGHPIPICGSGSESERNVLAHRSACCRRCALRRRLAIGSLGAGKPAVQPFIACLCRHTTKDRPSLIAPGFVSFADNGGLFRCFGVAPKAAAHGGCRYEGKKATPPNLFITSPHPANNIRQQGTTAGVNARPTMPSQAGATLQVSAFRHARRRFGAQRVPAFGVEIVPHEMQGPSQIPIAAQQAAPESLISHS